MRKFGTCGQWHGELFTIRMFFLPVGNGAMNAQRHWQLRYDACSDAETSANILLRVEIIRKYTLVYVFVRSANNQLHNKSA